MFSLLNEHLFLQNIRHTYIFILWINIIETLKDVYIKEMLEGLTVQMDMQSVDAVWIS